MHPVICGIGGYTLLLSSSVMFVMLLKKGLKRFTTSPFYVLSTSDILTTVFTSIVLLLNHINAFVTNNEKHGSNGIINLNNSDAWNVKLKSGNGNANFVNHHEDNDNAVIDETDAAINTCSITNVLLHYAMFLAPLTSGFTSLLIFSIHCNLNAICMNEKCKKLLLSQKRIKKQTEEADEEQILKAPENLIPTEKSVYNILNFFSNWKSRNATDNKIASLCVTGQWFVTIATIGILYFAEYKDTNSLGTNDLDCIFTSNYPFENCQPIIDSIDYPFNKNPLDLMLPTDNYTFDNDLFKAYISNSSEIDHVISKIHKIVQFALNDTDKGFENMQSSMYNKSELLSYQVQDVTTDDTKTELDSSFATLIQDDFNKSHYQIKNWDQGVEVSLFNDLIKVPVKNTSVLDNINHTGFSTDVFQLKKIDQTVVTEETTPSVSTLSNDQIYADIMKRIQSHSQIKKPRYNFLQRQNAGYTWKKYLMGTESKNDTRYSEMEDAEACTMSQTKAKCLVSTNFLRLHLLTLLILVYFLPILFSSIIQERGKLMCQNILDILEEKDAVVSDVLPAFSKPSDSTCGTSGAPNFDRLFEYKSKDGKGGKETSLRVSESYNGETDNTETIRRRTDSEIRDFEYARLCIVDDVKHVQKLCDTVRTSLLLGILLWTPIFLEILFKVFLCTHVSKWITDGTFLTAISFGIVRNILNYKTIQIQEDGIGMSRKENIVHPL